MATTVQIESYVNGEKSTTKARFRTESDYLTFRNSAVDLWLEKHGADADIHIGYRHIDFKANGGVDYETWKVFA